MCVCVCVCVKIERQRRKPSENHDLQHLVLSAFGTLGDHGISTSTFFTDAGARGSRDAVSVSGTLNYNPEENQLHLCVGTQELQERYRLSSAPKIGKRCPMGTEKVSCPEGKQNPKKPRNNI